MFTVMFWIPKNELRAVPINEPASDDPYVQAWNRQTAKELVFLDEHKDNPPSFETAEEASLFIQTRYPHLAP